MRLMTDLRRRRERGATSVLVVVLLVPVLLGAAALSFDMGQLMWERRQLQNGADATVMTVAVTCAKTPASCPTATNTALTTLAGQNANDGFETVASICGNSSARATVPALSLCPTPNGAVTECPSLPSSFANIPFVEVRTTTKNSNGTATIASKFASVATRSTRTTTVKACARAAWGTPGSSTPQLPLTVSGCDWQHATGGTAGGGSGAYYTPPVYNGATTTGYGGAGQPVWPTRPANPPAQNLGGEVILMLQNPPSGHLMPTSCPTWQGHALPGGFGVLETTADPCVAKGYPYSWFHTSSGSNVSCRIDQFVGKIVNLPVFDCSSSYQPASATVPPAGGTCTEGNGSNAWYHVQGWASFYLSGYSLNVSGGGPNRVKSINPNYNAFPCSSSESCISGWFTTSVLNATTVSGPPTGGGYFGSIAVAAAG